MNASANEATIIELLDSLADEGLNRVIAQSKTLKQTRANKRRNDALVQIRQLAKDHGLGIAIKQPARKRGRPRKSSSE